MITRRVRTGVSLFRSSLRVDKHVLIFGLLFAVSMVPMYLWDHREHQGTQKDKIMGTQNHTNITGNETKWFMPIQVDLNVSSIMRRAADRAVYLALATGLLCSANERLNGSPVTYMFIFSSVQSRILRVLCWVFVELAVEIALELVSKRGMLIYLVMKPVELTWNWGMFLIEPILALDEYAVSRIVAVAFGLQRIIWVEAMTSFICFFVSETSVITLFIIFGFIAAVLIRTILISGLTALHLSITTFPSDMDWGERLALFLAHGVSCFVTGIGIVMKMSLYRFANSQRALVIPVNENCSA